MVAAAQPAGIPVSVSALSAGRPGGSAHHIAIIAAVGSMMSDHSYRRTLEPRRWLGMLAAVVAVLALAAPAQAAPINFSNVIVTNVGSGAFVEFNGLHNRVTAGFTPSSMYQNDCGSYFVNGAWQQACEWHNASGYCMDASAVDGLVYAETCTPGYRQELWITTNGPNGPNNPGYWFNNVYWCQQATVTQFMTQVTSSVPSTIGANYSAGFGNAAVWHVGS